MRVDEALREFRLTGPLAPESGRSDRFSAENEDGSYSRVPCFAIRAGEPVKQVAVRSPLRPRDRRG